MVSFWPFNCIRSEDIETQFLWLTEVKFSPMSPKLFRTYPHREEDRGIDLAPLFLWLVLLKLLCNQLKIFVNLTFSQKVWPFVLFWFTSCAELRVLWVQQNRSDILVLLWQKCQIFKVFYLWLKKFDTKINAILVISELMASAGKVLRRFRRHGEKFTTAVTWKSCLNFWTVYKRPESKKCLM